MNQTIAAIVPMRHSSERVPGKNYRDFAGKPLYHYVVETLRDCPSIDQVVIDTDSDLIMQDAREHFPDVELLERPEHLRSGMTSMNSVLEHTITQIEADYYLQTHSTNPLLGADTLEAALQRFFDAMPDYDSLFSVTRLQTRLWDELGRAINHNSSILLRTQDLPPVYEENSCFYLFTADILSRYQNRIGARAMMAPIDPIEAMDIDEEVDFKLAEAVQLMRERGE
ncbi:cytidylyltransferase domain-containing protein [Parasphingopyxis lamellibrachiae]|uniref:CMP-N-acetylneuraminic acid synthetase n=1 Tax=Parasphingopyxis lamellibrachiae TaxID=680125 RepID=A0A3D9FF20_9SPHN|nr:acylneuraminate cytidylyltransferase family protein [Parasphingopyxis lamellibrachiae]RED16177.1 CMP-N-acetylneuraminic acid synthetase [Parasphingopyxis lamellibrachiae]